MANAGSSSSRSIDGVFVDGLYFSALFNYDELFPISDEKYASELLLQEALFSSSSNSRLTAVYKNAVSISESHQVIDTMPRTGKQIIYVDEIEIESPRSTSVCMICMDEKSISEIFRGIDCNHSFCTDCVQRYVAEKIKENIGRIKCPDVNCARVLEPYTCREIVPAEVFDRWEAVLCESMLVSLEKFYCPFKDCSAMMVDDGDVGQVTVAECPSCHRLFCAQCKTAWHSGIGCEEFKKGGKGDTSGDDLAVMEMAKVNQWRRCPKCKFFVEKKDGCQHITCRCGNQFCYGCGSPWSSYSHACSSPHM